MDDAEIRRALLDARAQGELPEDVIEALLPAHWQRLFPLRVMHGERIRAVLERRPDVGVDARVAFGLGVAEQASPSLYRDFYVNVRPDRDSVDAAIGALRRGIVDDFARQFSRAAEGLLDWQRVWYHLSVLSGRVIGPLRVSEGDDVYPAPLEPEPQPPGDDAWRAVHRPRDLAAAMSGVLREPFSIERHRLGLLESLDALSQGKLSDDEADVAAAILRHQTDLPVSLADGRPRVGAGSTSREEAAKLCTLEPLLDDYDQFALHQFRGLSSPSRPRRFLSCALLRIDGSLDDSWHPDDGAPNF